MEAESKPASGQRGLGLDYAFDFLFAAHRAFIKSDNFFLAAALIGGRLLAFLGADFPFHFAHRCFIASEMRLRAAALNRRRFLAVAGLAWLPSGRRPRRAVVDLVPQELQLRARYD